MFWTGSGYEMATLEKKRIPERSRLPSDSGTVGYGQYLPFQASPRNRSTAADRARPHEEGALAESCAAKTHPAAQRFFGAQHRPGERYLSGRKLV